LTSLADILVGVADLGLAVLFGVEGFFGLPGLLPRAGLLPLDLLRLRLLLWLVLVLLDLDDDLVLLRCCFSVQKMTFNIQIKYLNLISVYP